MGLVLNPVAFRVGHLNSWSDAWYMHRMYYPVFLHNVLLIKALIYYILYLYFPGRRSKWVYSHTNLFILYNKIFLNIYLYDARKRWAINKYALGWEYKKFSRLRLKTFWMKKKLLDWNYLGQFLFILLGAWQIKLDYMSFDYLNVKYSYRKVKRLKRLIKRKRRQGKKDFVTHEELRMFKRMLDLVRGNHKRKGYGCGNFANFGIPYALKYFSKWYKKAFKFKFNIKFEPYYFRQDVKKWRRLKYNYIFLFYILNFIDFLFWKSNATWPNFIFDPADLKQAMLFYFFWFGFRTLYFRIKKLIELIVLKFGFIANVKIYLLDNATISAAFISRYIGHALSLKFNFWDFVIPIRKSLNKLLYSRFDIGSRVMPWLSDIISDNARENKRYLYNFYKNRLIFIVSKLLISFYDMRSKFMFIFKRKLIKYLKNKNKFFLNIANDLINYVTLIKKQLNLKFFYLKKIKINYFYSKNNKYFYFFNKLTKNFLCYYFFFIFLKTYRNILKNRKKIFKYVIFILKNFFKININKKKIFINNNKDIIENIIKFNSNNNVSIQNEFNFFSNFKKLNFLKFISIFRIANLISYFLNYKIFRMKNIYFKKKRTFDKFGKRKKKKIRLSLSYWFESFFTFYIKDMVNKFFYLFYFKLFFIRLYYKKLFNRTSNRFVKFKYKRILKSKMKYFLKTKIKLDKNMKFIFWKLYLNLLNKVRIVKKFRNEANNPIFVKKSRDELKLLSNNYYIRGGKLQQDKPVILNELLKYINSESNIKNRYNYIMVNEFLKKKEYVNNFNDKEFNYFYQFKINDIEELMKLCINKIKLANKIVLKLKKYFIVKEKVIDYSLYIFNLLIEYFYFSKMELEKQILKKNIRKNWFLTSNRYFFLNYKNFINVSINLLNPFPYDIVSVFKYIKKMNGFKYYYANVIEKMCTEKELYEKENMEVTPLKYKLKRLKYFDTNHGLLYGYKFQFKGRFTRKQKAANLWFARGAMPVSTMSQNVDRSSFTVTLQYSACTVTIWLYKGEEAPKFVFRMG